ncbi:hypothetical protein CASFOL_034601 [Castilleja foliolosa]|uniref:Uncharacterized protein n=1 Tax=Castilleja foliolosa TaxID=1961234 RepID=A0ABD3BRE7_9LAMI
MEKEREELVYLARLAEQAERYDVAIVLGCYGYGLVNKDEERSRDDESRRGQKSRNGLLGIDWII